MVSTGYSKSILKGLRKRGITAKAAAEIAGLTPARLKAVLEGQAQLTGRNITRIEEATGWTGGQLAALAVEPKGGPLTEFMNMWANAVPPRKAASKPAARRVARR